MIKQDSEERWAGAPPLKQQADSPVRGEDAPVKEGNERLLRSGLTLEARRCHLHPGCSFGHKHPLWGALPAPISASVTEQQQQLAVDGDQLPDTTEAPSLKVLRTAPCNPATFSCPWTPSWPLLRWL